MEKVLVKAPAKINLYLRVIRKRPDGYHDIESLMQAIDLYDELALEKSDVIGLYCDDPTLPADESNLAYKAAAMLQSRFFFPGVRMELAKRIPRGAGLGGGSSDAAFVIRGLCRLYGLKPEASELLEMAAAVGSDVPFFLSGGQALVTGRGEIVRPVGLPLGYLVLVAVPPLSISTADVYEKQRINLTKKGSMSLLEKRINLSRLVSLMNELKNDLEDIVLSVFPELGELRRSLLGSGALYSSMSGSGSAFFGVFPRGARLDRAIESLKGLGCRVFQCRPILLPPFES